MIELPAVDLTRCRGAGDCVRVCPVACLEMAGGGPRLARPADCLSCGLCVLVCPNDALRMEAAPPDED
jgi:NAD-dependent dihydropyrimidine dehydrogenase PreA subunit